MPDLSLLPSNVLLHGVSSTILFSLSSSTGHEVHPQKYSKNNCNRKGPGHKTKINLQILLGRLLVTKYRRLKYLCKIQGVHCWIIPPPSPYLHKAFWKRKAQILIYNNNNLVLHFQYNILEDPTIGTSMAFQPLFVCP